MSTASGDLVISNFKVGIGPSPHMGFGDMRNLDTTTRPGIARINNSTEKKSGTAVSDVPISMITVRGNTLRKYALDASSVLYRSDDGGDTWYVLTSAPTGLGAGKGIGFWQDFLFYAGTPTLYAYGPHSGGPTASWYTIGSIQSDDKYHPMLTSTNDGKLYGGAAHKIFSVALASPTATFSPTGGATSHTFNADALDLPDSSYRIKCLAELGDNLMIGTDYAASTLDNEIIPNGVLFPWDRTSPSFGTPMVMNENGINQMITVNQVLYIQAGINGKYFKSNGVQFQQIAQLPNYLVNMDAGRYLENIPGGMTQYKGKIFFGVAGATGTVGTDLGGMGVWSIDPVTNALAFEHSISTESMGATSNVRVGAIMPRSHSRLLIGWKDGATAGIDMTGTARYQNYQGYLDSPFYQVGSPLIKKEFSQLEFQLVEPLATGQGVKISYRTDLSAAYTLIGTYDFATLGSVSSHNAIANIPACEFVQLRVALTTAAATNASPQLRTITLR